MKKALLCSLLSAMLFCGFSGASEAATNLKLYRLNCGNVHVSDLNIFSDTQAFTGQEKALTVSCYIIKHGEDVLLWDTGLPSAIADMPDGKKAGAFTLSIDETLTDQLKKIGLSPEDITHVGLSHSHFDHTGNVNLFTNAQLIIQKAEYEALTNTPDDAKAHNMDPANISYFLNDENKAQLNIISGDSIILGDKRLQTISLPGHTPGHMALLLDLPNTGKIILSGDQWHFTENHEDNGVPTFNYDRADTLASSDKLNNLIKNLGAKLIIQHEVKDNEALPKLPEYLD